MIKIEKNPDIETIKRCYDSNEAGMNDRINEFVMLLEIIQNNLVINVVGEYGSGKTFLLKTVDEILNGEIEISNNLKIRKTYRTLYYNAWENDFYPDPLISIMASLISKFDDKYITNGNESFLNRFLKFSTKIIGHEVDLSLLKSKSDFDDYFDMSKLKENMKKYMKDTVQESADNLVIFVDDLDRCNPKFVIKLLERIKNFFNMDYITFVVATDSVSLAEIVRGYYGNEFNSNKYLSKFFDVNFIIHENKFEFVEGYLKLKLNNLDRKTDDQSSFGDFIIHDMCKLLDFTFRDVDRLLLYLAKYFNDDKSRSAADNIMRKMLIPAVITLNIKYPDKFLRLVQGDNKERKNFYDIISKCKSKEEFFNQTINIHSSNLPSKDRDFDKYIRFYLLDESLFDSKGKSISTVYRNTFYNYLAKLI